MLPKAPHSDGSSNVGSPQLGQIVRVRSRQYVVDETVPPQTHRDPTLVSLSCKDYEAQDMGLELLWGVRLTQLC